jgi:EAL domain-containing protein (putative c-di-GMP-specific phosphodiesterase class I)
LEFILHYQPQVCTKTNRIIGAEALLRWNHPELGMIPPVLFILLAEQTGLIGPIGEWVLKAACKQHRYKRFLPDSDHITALTLQYSIIYCYKHKQGDHLSSAATAGFQRRNHAWVKGTAAFCLM